MDPTIRRRTPWLLLAAVGILAAAARIPLLPLHAYRWTGGTDAGEYKTWMQALHEHGLLNIFRVTDTDYVGYHLVLWLLTLVYSPFSDSYGDTGLGLHILVKVPPLLFDAALIAMVYVVTRDLVARAAASRPDAGLRPEVMGVAAAAVAALYPAFVYDSAVWAQIDNLTAVSMLASIYLVMRRMPFLAGVCWGASFFMKPQPIVIAPLLAVLAFDRGDWRTLVRLGAGGFVAGVVLASPWILHGDLIRIGRIYKTLANEDVGRLSGNAFNVWWFRDVAAHPHPGDRILHSVPVTYRMVGTLLTGIVALLAVAYAWLKPDLHRALIAGAFLTFGFYMVSTSSHDRYLYPMFILLLPVIAVDRRWLWIWAPLSVTFMLTLVISAPPSAGWAHGQLDSPLTLALAAINVVVFAAFAAVLAADVAARLRAPGPPAADVARAGDRALVR